MYRRAVTHLRGSDPVIATIIDRVGPCRITLARDRSHFEAIARAIVYQQLSGRAAATIFGRFRALFDPEPISPQHLLSLREDALRATGLSTQKTRYVRDLAARVAGGEVAIEALDKLGDDDVLEQLTRVKGVGRWTAQMFLMFRLGRLD